MDLDIDKYRHAVQPTNIFELLPRPIIEQMVRGFFYRLKKGVTLLWSEYDAEQRRWVVNEGRVDPFDYDNPEDRQFYNEVCWEYRQCDDKDCLRFDREVAQEHVDGKRTGVDLYPCWLGLDDLAFPLRIGDPVRAVVFAGQIVPDDDARLKEIEEKISKHIPAPLDEKLIELLHEERRRQWGPDPQYAQTLRKGLTKFGDTIQSILTQLYEARKEAATRELLQRCEERLASGDLTDRTAWWDNCGRLCAEFAGLVGLEAAHCYERARKKYECRLPAGALANSIAPREVLSVLTAGQLHHAPEDARMRALVTNLDVPAERSWFYVSHTPAARRMLSTLIVLLGDLDEQYKAVTESFCKIVAQRADFFSFVEQQRAADQEYRETVAEVAHDFRIPLQLVVFDVEAVARLDVVKKDEDLSKQLNRCVTRAFGAEEHVQRLLGTAVEKERPTDVVALVEGIMVDLRPMADQHPCKLVRVGKWERSAFVLGVEFQLRRAISNLLENAIKYSYKRRWVGFRQELYRINVSVGRCGDSLVRVSISNYGIGIPEELLDRIRAEEPIGRGEVPDGHQERPGTGWGLPIAIGVLEDHNGWLDIRSEPADGSPRGPGEEHHRYLTTVEAHLPTAR